MTVLRIIGAVLVAEAWWRAVADERRDRVYWLIATIPEDLLASASVCTMTRARLTA